MEAREYLEKVTEICDDYESNGCKGCPLKPLNCGLPCDINGIESVLDIAEHYEENEYPFGRCNNCKKEFNSELISEYEIKFCPWCGAEIPL